jgi:DNA-binding NarL/FixJ family response regulator
MQWSSVATVGAVCEGESVLAPDALRRLLGGVTRVSTTGHDGPGWTGLTQVERSVLAMLAAGRTNKEIAHQLRSSVGSVKKSIQRLLKVLAVSDRTQAAVEAVRRKLVDQAGGHMATLRWPLGPLTPSGRPR